MIKCVKCDNETFFTEIYIGGFRRHQWSQEKNGRFVFDGSNYDRVDDILFECSKCHNNMSASYREFLQALNIEYDEKNDGP